VTRPPEWWDVDNPGARLAVLLCGVCPALERCRRLARRPAGVVWAGVAYSDAGVPLPICSCGYPDEVGTGRGCRWCGLDSLPGMPRRLYWWIRYRQQRERAAERDAA